MAVFVFVTILLAIAGCAGPASAPSSPFAQPTEATASPKRITVAIRGAPHGFYNKLVQGVPGSGAVEEFVNAGLAHSDDRGELRPQLAEVVPDYDALYERYLATIPRGERMQVVARMLEHLADRLPSMPIFYRVEATMISHRLKGVALSSSESSRGWNVHEWDVSG